MRVLIAILLFFSTLTGFSGLIGIAQSQECVYIDGELVCNEPVENSGSDLLGAIAVGFLINLVLAGAVNHDASRRGNSPFWAIAVLPMGLIGVLAYLIVRNPIKRSEGTDSPTKMMGRTTTPIKTEDRKRPWDLRKLEEVEEDVSRDYEFSHKVLEDHGHSLNVMVTDGEREGRFYVRGGDKKVNPSERGLRQKFGDEWVNQAEAYLNSRLS